MNNDITRSIDDMNVIITKIKGYRVFTFFLQCYQSLECIAFGVQGIISVQKSKKSVNSFVSTNARDNIRPLCSIIFLLFFLLFCSTLPKSHCVNYYCYMRTPLEIGFLIKLLWDILM